MKITITAEIPDNTDIESIVDVMIFAEGNGKDIVQSYSISKEGK